MYSSCCHRLAIEPLTEIALVVEQADADERDAEIRRALQMIARENPQTARVDRHRFVQPELGREIRDRPRAEHAGVTGAPRVLRVQVLLQAAIGMIDPPVQRELRRAHLELMHVDLLQQRNRIVIAPLPEHRDRDRETARRSPSPSSTRDSGRCAASRRCTGATNCPSVRASLTIGASCTPSRREHAHVLVGEGPRFRCLDDEHTLEHAAVHDRHAEKRAESVLADVAEILEAGMRDRIRHDDRLRLLGDETGESFGHPHAHLTDALRTQADGGRQYEVGAILLEHVHRAHVSREPLLNQVHDVGERFRGIAAV